jgi:hypothetical protein
MPCTISDSALFLAVSFKTGKQRQTRHLWVRFLRLPANYFASH